MGAQGRIFAGLPPDRKPECLCVVTHDVREQQTRHGPHVGVHHLAVEALKPGRGQIPFGARVKHGTTAVQHDPVRGTQWDVRIGNAVKVFTQGRKAFDIKELRAIDAGEDFFPQVLNRIFGCRVCPSLFHSRAQFWIENRAVELRQHSLVLRLPF
ncbi:MAG: hypothetical protein ABJV68_15140 [Paracoccaceae bacterium]